MAETSPKKPAFYQSLSARLLVMTVFFVMLAELFIYTLSVARYRKSYLEERIVRARLASLAVETMPHQAEDKTSATSCSAIPTATRSSCATPTGGSQTLDYAAVSASGRGRPVSPADIAQSAGELIVAEAQAAGAPDLAWCAQVQDGLMVSVDKGQSIGVFENLGRNARQAGARSVTVTAQAYPDYIAIDVTDDGPGLPEKARENLFQPFAGSAREGGTGVGLVIAREALRVPGGEFDLIETSVRGTRFRMTVVSAAVRQS